MPAQPYTTSIEGGENIPIRGAILWRQEEPELNYDLGLLLILTMSLTIVGIVAAAIGLTTMICMLGRQLQEMHATAERPHDATAILTSRTDALSIACCTRLYSDAPAAYRPYDILHTIQEGLWTSAWSI